MPTKPQIKVPALMEEEKATENYLQQNYCTLEHLLKTCDLSEAEFFAYIDAGCLPQHSYEWQEKRAVHSFLGTQEWVTQTRFYYHSRHILLLQDLITWHRYMPFEEMAKALAEDFKVHYLAKLKELDVFSDVMTEYVDETGVIKQADLDVFLNSEWQGYLEGIYGLCTNEPTPENIAMKEMMIRRIRLLTSEGAKASLSVQGLQALKEIICALDAVLSPFAPYERPYSTREKWINSILTKYTV